MGGGGGGSEQTDLGRYLRHASLLCVLLPMPPRGTGSRHIVKTSDRSVPSSTTSTKSGTFKWLTPLPI